MKRHQLGFGLLHVFAIFAFAVLAVVGTKLYQTHVKKAEAAKQQAQKAALQQQLQEQKRSIGAVLTKWDDALHLAGMTSRIALAQPISQMQAIRREVKEIKENECFDNATSKITEGMDNAIFAFEMFVKFPNNGSASETTSKYLGSSTQKIEEGKQGIDACILSLQ